MMKKLFVLVLVLAISTMATAATVDLVITAGPDPVGTDPGSGAPSYKPSDTITIALVAAGFTSGPTTAVHYLDIATVTTDNDGTASDPALVTALTGAGIFYHGTLVNEGGILIEIVKGGTAIGDQLGVASGDLWSFNYHFPDLPWSTIITIDLTDLLIRHKYGQPLVYTYGGALEIHVVPEPMTIALLGLGGLFLRRRK